jgi:hypothetical protein
MLLPDNIAHSRVFVDELKAMLRKIACTNFIVIAKILRENINTDESATANWYAEQINKCRPLLRLTPEELRLRYDSRFSIEDCTKSLEEYSAIVRSFDEGASERPQYHTLDDILRLLLVRQQQLRNILCLEREHCVREEACALVAKGVRPQLNLFQMMKIVETTLSNSRNRTGLWEPQGLVVTDMKLPTFRAALQQAFQNGYVQEILWQERWINNVRPVEITLAGGIVLKFSYDDIGGNVYIASHAIDRFLNATTKSRLTIT